MSVARTTRTTRMTQMIEVVSGLLLLTILLAFGLWWNAAVLKPRDRLLECGSNKECRAVALRGFTSHRVVTARFNQLTR